jgi:hypothetical protein
VFSEEMARRLLLAMNEQQATSRTDVDVFPAAVARPEETLGQKEPSLTSPSLL